MSRTLAMSLSVVVVPEVSVVRVVVPVVSSTAAL
jgi:hypothetical protein